MKSEMTARTWYGIRMPAGDMVLDPGAQRTEIHTYAGAAATAWPTYQTASQYLNGHVLEWPGCGYDNAIIVSQDIITVTLPYVPVRESA